MSQVVELNPAVDAGSGDLDLDAVFTVPEISGGRLAFADMVARVLLGRSAAGEFSQDRSWEAEQTIALLETAEFACGPLAAALSAKGWTLGAGLTRAILAELESKYIAYDGPPTAGFYTDFLGVRTRIEYMMGAGYLDGAVLAPPSIEQAVAFDWMEWMQTFRAVEEARSDRPFVVMELGAGWGPWLVTAGAAARHRGIPDIRMVGVEADAHHFGYMRRHLADNGFDPDGQTLIQAIVGAEDGTAKFPRLRHPTFEWGAQASFGDEAGAGEVEYVDMPCLGLRELIERTGRIDLIHCDIQGAEEAAIPAAAEALTRNVRRLVLGTHSRSAEGAALRALAPHGWTLDGEAPTKFAVADGADRVFVDGLQIWHNPALAD